MAMPLTDTFTGTNGDTLEDYSSNWTINDVLNSSFEIYGNECAPASASEGIAHRNDEQPNNDQYAEATAVSFFEAANYEGVACRVLDSSTVRSGYGYYSDGYNNSYLFELDGGGWTGIGTAGAVFEDSDTIRIEAEGTAIRGIVNSSTRQSGTNTTFSSGYGGVCGYGGSGVYPTIDDLEIGNLTSAVPVAAIVNSYRRRRV